MTNWPKDNQSARNAFYGDPGKGEIARQMVSVIPPFAMHYDGKRIKSISFHRKAAPALRAALDEIWDYCQHDQAKIDAAGVSKYAGAYNHRMVRGSRTKWSNHAYGAAIDLNAAENGLYQKGNMPQFVIDAFLRQGWMWGGFYSGRKDPMHFEAVDNGGRKPKSPRPVWPPVARLFDEPAQEVEAEEVDDGSDKAILVLVQTKLDAMHYSPGLIDGLWGSNTAGAIGGFLNDRDVQISAPTSNDAWLKKRDAIISEIDAAQAEGFTRPVSDGRASADPAVVARVAPEVVPAKRGFLAATWGSVIAALTAVWDTVSEPVKSAWEFFTGHKDDLSSVDPGILRTATGYLAAVPVPVWIFAGAGLLAFIAWQAHSSAKQITESVKTGARS